MKKIWYLLTLSFLILASCAGGESSREAKVSADTLSAEEKIRLAEEQKAAAEQARKDSLMANALRGDSLKEKHIVVDKEACYLYVRENDSTLMAVPVCVGMGIGQKKRPGDHKTPEGEFKVISKEDATGYLHDFHDGRGKVKGAYGKWFFRLNTPQSTHIGIHGTMFPESMGKRESDGCVRMRNEDLETLYGHVFVGMKVIINPDKVDA